MLIAGSAGQDRITIDAASGTTRVTTGGGQDVVALTTSGAEFHEGAILLTDFTVGARGDEFRFGDWTRPLVGFDGNGQLFADGYARLVQQGTGTALQIDLDGAGADSTWATLAVFRGVDAGAFVAENFDHQGQPVVVDAATGLVF